MENEWTLLFGHVLVLEQNQCGGWDTIRRRAALRSSTHTHTHAPGGAGSERRPRSGADAPAAAAGQRLAASLAHLARAGSQPTCRIAAEGTKRESMRCAMRAKYGCLPASVPSVPSMAA